MVPLMDGCMAMGVEMQVASYEGSLNPWRLVQLPSVTGMEYLISRNGAGRYPRFSGNGFSLTHKIMPDTTAAGSCWKILWDLLKSGDTYMLMKQLVRYGAGSSNSLSFNASSLAVELLQVLNFFQVNNSSFCSQSSISNNDLRCCRLICCLSLCFSTSLN